MRHGNYNSTRKFIGCRLKWILEAPNADDAIKTIPQIFADDFKVEVNGEIHELAWLEKHVREIYVRLTDISVQVTHAARTGSTLLERHIVTAKTVQHSAAWQLEVMAVYELTPDDRIKGWHELSNIRIGEYSGW